MCPQNRPDLVPISENISQYEMSTPEEICFEQLKEFKEKNEDWALIEWKSKTVVSLTEEWNKSKNSSPSGQCYVILL
jgi:hypothetical protein